MRGSQLVAPPAAGLVARQDFGSQSVAAAAETASSAVAAQAEAAVKARYALAMMRPRNWDDVRSKLMAACKRPSFAQQAIYRKPIGKGIEGPSIRFAEEALRAMGNAMADPSVVYDDARKRIVRVSVTDLEANVTHSKDAVIDKSVERSSGDGREVLGERTNAEGKRVYIVVATEDELLAKQSAIESKVMRIGVLRMLPADISEDCLAEARKTRAQGDAADPQAARKKVFDAFAAYGVLPSQIERYLGHNVDQATPGELDELRSLYAAMKEEETTWQAALDHKLENRVTAPPVSGATSAPSPPAPAAPKPASTAPKEDPASGNPRTSEAEPDRDAMPAWAEPQGPPASLVAPADRERDQVAGSIGQPANAELGDPRQMTAREVVLELEQIGRGDKDRLAALLAAASRSGADKDPLVRAAYSSARKKVGA